MTEVVALTGFLYEVYSCWVLFIKYIQYFRYGEKVVTSQQTFTCSKATIETLEKGVKYVQS